MTTASWPIPTGTKLVAEVDTRPESDIVTLLRSHFPPNDSEKNVWAYWHTGWDTMPSWCQRNVVDWVRQLGPSWTVRVLDGIEGSPTHFRRYLGPEHFPEALNANQMTGRYAATHTSDLLRLPLLYVHGGVWLDVGILLLRDLDDSVWDRLADPESPYEFAAFAYENNPGDLSVINPWLAARRDCELVKRWHQTFLHVWGSSTECTGLSSHELFRHLKPWAVGSAAHQDMDDAQKRAAAASIMDYGTQILCIERLLSIVDSQDGWDCRAWMGTKALLFPALKEMWQYQLRTNFLGSKQFELLTTRRDESEIGKREEAEEFVQDLLANSMMMKLCHGAGIMKSNLADFWDDPKHEGTDYFPDTFAGYLRWGSISLRQTRSLEAVKLTPSTKPPCRVGIFEPVPS